MGVPISDVGYTSTTTGRGDHEVHKGHVVALGVGGKYRTDVTTLYQSAYSYFNEILKINVIRIGTKI
jgi:hypothetical protein